MKLLLAILLASGLAAQAGAQGRAAARTTPGGSGLEAKITRADFEKSQPAPGSPLRLVGELKVTKSGSGPPSDVWLVLYLNRSAIARQKFGGSDPAGEVLRHTFEVKAPDSPGQACFELVASLGPAGGLRLDARRVCVKLVSQLAEAGPRVGNPAPGVRLPARAETTSPSVGRAADGGIGTPKRQAPNGGMGAGSDALLPAKDLLPELVAPFKFAGAYYFYANEKKVEATGSGNGWKLPVTDGQFLDSGVKLLWSFAGPVEDDLKKVVNEKQCCLKVLVNGIKVSNPEVSFSAPGQLRTTTALDTSPGGWPKSVNIEVTYGGKTYKSAQVTIHAGPLISFFADYIYPTFQHSRCQDCHSMGTGAAIVAQHKNAPYSIDLYQYMQASQIQPDKTEGCAGCHGADPSLGPKSLEWKSPSALKGIDWRSKSAKQICQTVLSKLPAGDQVHAHFNEDPRIEWALSSGWVPMGFAQLSTAPPGFTKFLKRIDKWIAAGLPCPP